MPADHVTQVDFRHFVIGQIGHGIAFLAQIFQQRFAFGFTASDFDSGKNLRIARIGVTVVEFGNRAMANCMAEFAETAGAFGNRYCQQHFTSFAEFGTFGNVAHPVEVNVRTAGNRD